MSFQITEPKFVEIKEESLLKEGALYFCLDGTSDPVLTVALPMYNQEKLVLYIVAGTNYYVSDYWFKFDEMTTIWEIVSKD